MDPERAVLRVPEADVADLRSRLAADLTGFFRALQ